MTKSFPKKFPSTPPSAAPPAPPPATRSDGVHPLQAVEDDLKTLVCRLGSARLALAEQEKRSEQEMRRFLLLVVDVLDRFEDVFRNVEERKKKVTTVAKSWLGNFRTIHRLLKVRLIEQDVTEIGNFDDGFDPHWHKVAEIVADPARADGTIVEVVLPGYVWRGQILRKAEVVVVRNAGGPAEDDGANDPAGDE